MNSPVEESMQVEVSEGATAPQSVRPAVQLASSLPPIDLSFLGDGPIPFLPPRQKLFKPAQKYEKRRYIRVCRAPRQQTVF